MTMLSIGLLGFFACGDSEDEKPTTPPATQPQTSVGDNASSAQSQGNQQEDVDGICVGVADYVGVCDPDIPSFAWFCYGEELYLLDCEDIAPGYICVEDDVSWDCMDGGFDTGWYDTGY